MILICEQCEKSIEFRPCDRETITIKCSCGAVYEIDVVNMDYKRILTIQDISCVGQCSLTVALPIISACGVETCILPSAVPPR